MADAWVMMCKFTSATYVPVTSIKFATRSWLDVSIFFMRSMFDILLTTSVYVSYRIPDTWKGQEIRFRWDSGSEATLWSEDGAVLQVRGC